MHIGQFFSKEKTDVGTNHTYGLTPLGKTKAEELALQGKKGLVAASLNENGASSISEISEDTKISSENVKTLLRILLKNGYARKVSSEE